MIADDPLLPSAPHLIGPDANDLLHAAVAAAGGRLDHAQMVQVQYRPGADLVVRYDAKVSWRGGAVKPETLLAGVTTSGAFPGTLPLEAGDLVAGVWRYPFDPRLPGLAAAVTPSELAQRLHHVIPDIEHIKVRAYRPVRRAVVHVRGTDGQEVYVKVVRPSAAAAIAQRHEELAAGGLPVPTVLDVDLEAGLLVLAPLAGESLRTLVMQRTSGWPPASDHRTLLDALAQVGSPPPTSPSSPTHAASSHAAAITAVLPDEHLRLERIVASVSLVRPTMPAEAVTVHGDYYESQVMVTDARISGLLDLDDVGSGHPLDDPATILAHLHVLRPGSQAHRARLSAYRGRLRTTLAQGRDLADLDRRTAGVLVGLATGPFRAQSEAWRREVRRRLAMAGRLVARHPTDGGAEAEAGDHR
jgi:aminoglycoside phosphotransferase (APT) family kinase protein